jgi:outer membrane beta-barrel protein
MYILSSMKCYSSFVFAALFVIPVAFARAQILPREDQQADAGLEDLYDKYEQQENTQRKKAKEAQDAAVASPERRKEIEQEVNKLSQLANLAPFQDIAVIQRRYLPKTYRLEMSGSGLFSTNNAYFNNLGLSARLGFYFHERYGVEATYQAVTSTERPITEGLIDNQNIRTAALVEPESYYGLMFKWVPVYGKMAWFQEKIIPYDFYFTPGFGMSTTTGGESESTLSLGMGQLFALSKSFGVRWDFYWNYYQATVNVDGKNEKQNHSDLFLSIGLSYFIPEATYR